MRDTLASMRHVHVMAILVSAVFILASMGMGGEEAAGETCHEHGHCACVAFCSASCCKLLAENNTLTAPQYFLVSYLHSPEQVFHRTLVVRSIKHPPKKLI